MENEEKKSGCCGGKDKCEHGMTNCCHNWKKCHMIKLILIAVVLMIAFCMGTQWGEMRGDYRNNRFERGGMMNWSGNKFEKNYKGDFQQSTGEVTVKVTDLPAEGTVSPKQ